MRQLRGRRAADHEVDGTIERAAWGYARNVVDPVLVSDIVEALELAERGRDDLFSAGAPPPVLGFGISTPDHVRQALAAGAAGVISGSAIVGRVAEGVDSVRAFVASMKGATRGRFCKPDAMR